MRHPGHASTKKDKNYAHSYLLALCFMQLRNLPGVCLVVLEMVPSLSLQGLRPLAQAADLAAQALCSIRQEVAQELCSQKTLKAAGGELSILLGQSLDNAIYS